MRVVPSRSETLFHMPTMPSLKTVRITKRTGCAVASRMRDH